MTLGCTVWVRCNAPSLCGEECPQKVGVGKEKKKVGIEPSSSDTHQPPGGFTVTFPVLALEAHAATWSASGFVVRFILV